MSDAPERKVFSRSLRLVLANPVLLLPGLIVGLGFGAVAGLLAPPPTPVDTSDPTALVAADAGARYLGSVVVFGATLLATIVTNGLTIGMAGAAWDRGTARAADLAAALRRRGAQILATILLCVLIEVVLTILTFGLGALVFQFFSLYLFAAIVLGDERFAPGLRESVAITGRRFASSLTLVVLLFAVTIVLSVGAAVVRLAPPFGAMLATLAVTLLWSYGNVVVVGEYRGATAERQGPEQPSPNRTRP